MYGEVFLDDWLFNVLIRTVMYVEEEALQK